MAVLIASLSFWKSGSPPQYPRKIVVVRGQRMFDLADEEEESNAIQGHLVGYFHHLTTSFVEISIALSSAMAN